MDEAGDERIWWISLTNRIGILRSRHCSAVTAESASNEEFNYDKVWTEYPACRSNCRWRSYQKWLMMIFGSDALLNKRFHLFSSTSHCGTRPQKNVLRFTLLSHRCSIFQRRVTVHKSLDGEGLAWVSYSCFGCSCSCSMSPFSLTAATLSVLQLIASDNANLLLVSQSKHQPDRDVEVSVVQQR